MIPPDIKHQILKTRGKWPAYRAAGDWLLQNDPTGAARLSSRYEFPYNCLSLAKISDVFQSQEDCCSSSSFKMNVFSGQEYSCGTEALEC
jgi:hypothetical protein